jgi:hypothetical protein
MDDNGKLTYSEQLNESICFGSTNGQDTTNAKSTSKIPLSDDSKSKKDSNGSCSNTSCNDNSSNKSTSKAQ